MKIFVHLSGGNIQGIYSSDPKAEIFIVDYDVSSDAELEYAEFRQKQLDKALENGEIVQNY